MAIKFKNFTSLLYLLCAALICFLPACSSDSKDEPEPQVQPNYNDKDLIGGEWRLIDPKTQDYDPYGDSLQFMEDGSLINNLYFYDDVIDIREGEWNTFRGSLYLVYGQLFSAYDYMVYGDILYIGRNKYMRSMPSDIDTGVPDIKEYDSQVLGAWRSSQPTILLDNPALMYYEFFASGVLVMTHIEYDDLGEMTHKIVIRGNWYTYDSKLYMELKSVAGGMIVLDKTEYSFNYKREGDTLYLNQYTLEKNSGAIPQD